jgi:succinyl-CoA synthetase alpha subunit
VSILVDAATRVVVQGITGQTARTHVGLMRAYGTQILAGVSPGRGGSDVDGVPVFETVQQAIAATRANTSLVVLPPRLAAEGILEAFAAEVPLVVCITEGVPVQDMLTVLAQQRRTCSRLIGPNCPGLASPGESLVGVMPGMLLRPGPVGVVSRSGTLAYEVSFALLEAGLGQSTWVGVGGDALKGSRFVDVLPLFADDPQTRVVALLGEIGGDDEERAADLIARGYPKPVVALVAGEHAPRGRAVGHAGAIISSAGGEHAGKVEALRAAGVHVALSPAELAAQALLRQMGQSGSRP